MSKRLVILTAVLALVLSACTITEGKEYTVTPGGGGLYMTIKANFSKPIAVSLYRDICHENHIGTAARCTGNWLHDNVKQSGWGAAEWATATRFYGDLGNNLWQVLNRYLCLVLHKDWTSDLNWETSSCPGGPWHL